MKNLDRIMALTEQTFAESRASHIEPHDVNCGRGRERAAQSIIPIPREATSVATMMGLLPVLNSLSTQSRSFCCLSPWIARDPLALDTSQTSAQELTQRRPAVLSQEPSDVIGYTFSTSEDKDLVVLVFHDALKMLGHLFPLVEF